MSLLVLVAALYLAVSIVVIWMATFAIREDRRFRPFLPMLLIGFALCLMAAVFFYNMLLSLWHLIFTLLFIVGLWWMLCEYQFRNHL